MQIGLCLPTFEQIATRETIVRATELAEAEGYDSVWVTDHVIMAHGQEHPYGHIFEALATLAYAGALTQRVLLGTSILVLTQRNAIVVAKEMATLDALTNGRVILGVGAGWNEKEFNMLGANFHRRGKRLEEQIAVMRALWTQAPASFQGKHHRIEDALFSPKPVQAAGIPIWIGGNSDFAVQRAGRIGDGWHVTGMTADYIAQHRELLAQANTDGRPFTISARLEVDLNGRLPTQFTGPDGSKRRRLGGSLDQMRRDIEQYAQAGISHVVLVFMEPDVDSFTRNATAVARELLPIVREARR